MFTDVSIDLETLGVQPGSVITQIGLCAFDQRPGNTAKSCTNIRVNPQSMIDMGFTLDWSTIAWWLKQEELPRYALAEQKGDDIKHALCRVGDWFMDHGLKYRSMNVWGHGCGFDCTQLEIAFQKCGLPVPWDFRKVRDLRTLADLAPATRVERPTPAMAHDAMEDASAQAEWIQQLTWKIEKREVGRPIIEQPQQ